MTTIQQGAWRQRRRHWHCYADEVRVGEEVDYEGRRERTVAMTPDEVVAWMATEVDRILPRLAIQRRAEAERLRSDETFGESTSPR
jgi:hypothetical protein